MKSKLVKAVTVIAILFFVCSNVPLGKAQELTTLTYQLTLHPGDQKTYALTVTIPESLINDYSEKNHGLYDLSDYQKFVTPYTLKPIADTLWELYNTDEDFTNGVLDIVHQITYQATGPNFYPVETMAKGVGDCDLFAQIAASILQAGGINVVLLFYNSPNNQSLNHMQIGVHLQNPPAQARSVSSITSQGVIYYIAECTGGNWQSGWRVGECPPDYVGAASQVITLEKSEKTGTQTVFASLEEQKPSSLELALSDQTFYENSQITIKGQINPALANQNITLFSKVSNQWVMIGSVLTGQDGKFEFKWNPQGMGFCYLQAFWSGNRQYYGSNSQKENITILPDITYIVIGALAIALSAIMISYLLLNYAHLEKEKTDFKAAKKPLYPPGEP